MDKKAEFIKLAKEVKTCSACRQMKVFSKSGKEEYLKNYDDFNYENSEIFVNLWNLWHGDLNADIMVIGQDFGVCEDAKAFKEKQKSGNYKNRTDKKLRELFLETFERDIDKDGEGLFFTNVANCYRANKTTGQLHSGWLPICAHKFMFRLVDIVRPKIIIVLGQTAFEAMFCLNGAKIDCERNMDAKDNMFSSTIKNRYTLVSSEWSIPVFPVYHPGANSQRNRDFNLQKEDWKKIYEKYQKIISF